MLSRIFAVSALVLAMPALAATALPSNDMAGVWQGTLGKQRITVCFNGNTEQEEGAYYYQRHLQPIGLQPQNLRRWEETPGTSHPAWNLEAPAGGRVTGQWRAADGNSYLPIALQRVAASSPACASDAFNAPIEAHFRIETGKPKQFAETARSYRPLTYMGESSLELVGEGEVLAEINRELRDFLPLGAADQGKILASYRDQMGGWQSGAVDETDAYPVFWSPDFVAIDFYRWANGTGRNGISWEYRTWDLVSGLQVEPWSWVEVEAKEDGFLPPKGVEKFETPNPDRASCEGNYRSEGDWELTLESSGMRFWEVPYGEGECERDILVPYDKLDPFLTPEGKKAIARIRARPGVGYP